MNPSTTLAQSIVRQIIEAGITDVVISPGSRNAPLSLAFHHAASKKLITIHVRIDERGAAFFALGLAKATGRPVPVVCTSGTAVANYHPAILEAHHTNTPLLVLTADRPARLRKTGANQTTNQVKIFGSSVRYFADISGAAFPMEIPLHALLHGPVHLNIQFDEPLLPEGDGDWLRDIKSSPVTEYRKPARENFSTTTRRGVVVIGHDRGGFALDEVETFIAELGWPVISEDPISFPTSIAHASLFLTSQQIRQELKPHTAVIIGRTTLSRSVNALIATAAREVVIDSRLEYVDGDRRADERFTSLPFLNTEKAESSYQEKWQKYSEQTAQLLHPQWSEPFIVAEIVASLKTDTALFIASSRPIRDVEGFAKPRTGITTYANRGLAGIDGNVSTLLGIAHGHKTSVGVIGDLAFLHDMNAFVTTGGVNTTLFVINNDGGGIFSTLAQRGVEGFEEIFGAPHGHSIAAIAQSMKIESVKVTNFHELQEELNKPIAGVRVVEVIAPPREVNADYLTSLYQQINSL